MFDAYQGSVWDRMGQPSKIFCHMEWDNFRRCSIRSFFFARAKKNEQHFRRKFGQRLC
jgi:hypothetical protein